MTTDSTPPESPTPTPAARASGGALHVLLVDDQRLVAEVVRRMLLDQPDLVFHYCGDGAEAIRRIQEIQPDVILQDLVMPGLDGIELATRYRADRIAGEIPIILLSASTDPLTERRATAAGVNGFLLKPPAKSTLLEQIRAVSAVRTAPPARGGVPNSCRTDLLSP